MFKTKSNLWIQVLTLTLHSCSLIVSTSGAVLWAYTFIELGAVGWAGLTIICWRPWTAATRRVALTAAALLHVLIIAHRTTSLTLTVQHQVEETAPWRGEKFVTQISHLYRTLYLLNLLTVLITHGSRSCHLSKRHSGEDIVCRYHHLQDTFPANSWVYTCHSPGSSRQHRTDTGIWSHHRWDRSYHRLHTTPLLSQRNL